VNRGPDSRGVLNILLDLQRRCRLIPILGNHEEMMLESRHDRHAEERWRYQGGMETLLSYGYPDAVGNIPEEHWEFLRSFRPFYETDRFLFTHANYCWYLPMEQQSSRDLRWLSLEESSPRPHFSGKTVILGHTPGPVRDKGFYRCLDTGCGCGGRLTAMDLDSGTLWQVTESGETVIADPQ